VEQTPRKSKLPWILAILAVVIILPLGCCGGVLYWGVGMVKAPLEAATRSLEQAPEVTDVIGTPLTLDNAIDLTNYENVNGNGGADVDFNVTGPRGTAHVFGRVKLTAGNWTPENLTIELPDGNKIHYPSQSNAQPAGDPESSEE
jgi:hypothetical protein